MIRSLWILAAALFLLFGGSSQAEQLYSAWRTVSTPAYPKKRDDVVFVDARIGFYGTGAGEIYGTRDGGETWTLMWRQQGTFVRALGFLDSNNGFFGNLGAGLVGTTDVNPLYRTADGGATWIPVDIGGADVAGICAIDILRADAILEGDVRKRVVIHAAGRANGPAKLLRSEDGGERWTLIDLSERAGMILDVKFLDPSVGFIFAGSSADLAQSNALILRTSDGGRSWSEVYRSSRNHELIWKAAFPSPLIGYATIQNNDPANSKQRIVKTVDGGKTWAELPLVSDAGAQEFGVGFASTSKGWVGTAAGGFETKDGGKTWTPSTLAKSANKIRVVAADGSLMIYAIGTEVQIYH